MNSYDPLLNKLLNGTDDERKYICEKRIDLFALVYFSDYFEYDMAPFHYDFFEDGRKLETGELNEAMWVAFRESAKTSDAKIVVTHAICYGLKKYVLWGSYDKDNAEAALFDIIVNMQTNPKLLHDFGQLYNEARTDDEKKVKKVSNFITANDVKVEAISTQESTRGRVYKKNRPDFYIYDDIENDKTKMSVKTTRKIIKHVEEARAGMSSKGSLLILANYITETGVVEYMRRMIARNEKGITRRIDVIMKGKPTWRSKYAMTDEEARTTGKISLETKRKQLGETSWQENMMNNPAGNTEPFFERRRVDKDIERAVEAKKISAGFHIFALFNPAHRYASGHDVAMGVGLDSSTSAFIDFSRVPNLVVATYAENRIAPNVFAHEIKREAAMFGDPLAAPEANGEAGGACVETFKNLYDNVYQQRSAGKMYDKVTQKLGWRTTSASKATMFFQLKTDYEDGTLEILDERVLREMRVYTLLDLQGEDTVDNPEMEADPDLATRHFDLLTAVAIANMMRNHATFAKRPKRQSVPQRAYQTPSIEDDPGERVSNPTRRAWSQPQYEAPTIE